MVRASLYVYETYLIQTKQNGAKLQVFEISKKGGEHSFTITDEHPRLRQDTGVFVR